MDLLWDWLRPVMRVPYVPTLGPVHPDALGPELLADVLSLAGTTRFLPYDADRRWSALKDESVLLGDVEHGPDRTVIPTISTWGRGLVVVHYYGHAAAPVEELLGLARRLAAREDVDRARVVWCEPERPAPSTPSTPSGPPAPCGPPAPRPDATVTRLQLRTFQSGQSFPPSGSEDDFADEDFAADGIEDLRSLPDPVRARFEVFANQTAADGFAFLWRQFHAKALAGPILTLVSGERVIGAIGPMETMKDPVGAVRLLPQHFAVLPEHRGQGHGRRLWRAAMHWGRTNGADYELAQTVLDSAADRLGQAEGLTTLGFVHTVTA